MQGDVCVLGGVGGGGAKRIEVLDKGHKESKCYRNSEEPGGF